MNEKGKNFFRGLPQEFLPLRYNVNGGVQMGDQDRRTERQVWQRVFAPIREEPVEDLRPLLYEAMVLAGAYRNLIGVIPPQNMELARLLLQEAQANAACLRGMCRLSGVNPGRMHPHQSPKLAPDKLLEVCYHRSRRCMTEYTARSIQAEFGAAFRMMADREAQNAALVLQLLGSLGYEKPHV